MKIKTGVIMHIPDGYLGPQTYITAFAVSVPFWMTASKKLNKTLRSRQVPILALGAAFSFVIMMLNVPIVGGTTGHAVGAVLIAILLGPWAACIAVSTALIVQALIYGDGGITAIGANCLNMAVIMPFAGYWIYKLIAGKSDLKSPKRWIGAAIGGYIGINIAAITTGIMFGIQPLIAHDAAGKALYSPFSLKLAVSTMAIEHLVLFGFIEAMVTGLVIKYIQTTDTTLFFDQPITAIQNENKNINQRRLWIGLGVLIILSPLGLILPAIFNAGSAWGEWSADELNKMVGYLPKGMQKISDIWKAPMPDYALKGQENAPLQALSLDYILSAIIGVAVVVGLIILLGKLLAKKRNKA